MVSEKLLEILRCPVAVKTAGGNDPGRLTLVHDCWLVSEESGYKYPIIEDIPVMLVEVGEKFKETPIDALPVPPPRELVD